jgi:hypothetical protein
MTQVCTTRHPIVVGPSTVSDCAPGVGAAGQCDGAQLRPARRADDARRIVEE